MKLVVPSDWDGQSWDCCLLFYPNSRQWLGLVVGALKHLSRPYVWDDRFGDVYQASIVGRTIARSLNPSSELLQSDAELQIAMACLGEVVDRLDRIAVALEQANDRPDIDLSALDNLSELEGLLQLVQIAASLDPEMALLVSATQQVAGYLGGGE